MHNIRVKSFRLPNTFVYKYTWYLDSIQWAVFDRQEKLDEFKSGGNNPWQYFPIDLLF